MQKGEPDEAIDELKQIIEKSPDEDAIPSAHLSIGNILSKTKGDPDAALAEYKQVKGTLANYAGDAIAQIFRERQRPAEGAAILEELLAEAKGARTIALLLVTLSKLYQEAGSAEKALAALRRGEELIPEDKGYVPRFMNSAYFKETLEKIAKAKENGNDQEAEELLDEIRNPWRKRIREIRDLRRQRGGRQ